MNKNKKELRESIVFKRNRITSINLDVLHEISYDVVLNDNILSLDNSALFDTIRKNKIFCLIDKNVMDTYKNALINYFNHYNIEYFNFIIESSESNKKMESVLEFASFCFKNNIYRRDYIVCLGGGIVCDIGGFTANLIRRGTPCIKIPTSLIGIVDAAVGIKTGVNYYEKKNSLGTYSPPSNVFCDLNFLKTLPERHINNGLVEIVKIIALLDKEMWMLLYNNIDKFFKFPYHKNVEKIIYHSIVYMMEELKPNLFEKNLKRIVDYGHEFGHPIEILTEHELLHGEAVGIGMIISNCISLNHGVMKKEDFDMFIRLYQKLNIPFFHKNLTEQNLYSEIKSIKEHKNGNINLVGLKEIGKPCFLKHINRDDINFAIRTLKFHSKQKEAI